MRKSRYTDSQILAILKQNENGVPVPEVCREDGMSSAQFFKWREKFGGMDASLMKASFLYSKKDRVKRKIYPTRAQARADIFDYIEGFYNPRRNHGTNGGLFPVRYEKQYYQQLEDV